jgi:hypothetical protein
MTVIAKRRGRAVVDRAPAQGGACESPSDDQEHGLHRRPDDADLDGVRQVEIVEMETRARFDAEGAPQMFRLGVSGLPEGLVPHAQSHGRSAICSSPTRHRSVRPVRVISLPVAARMAADTASILAMSSTITNPASETQAMQATTCNRRLNRRRPTSTG